MDPETLAHLGPGYFEGQGLACRISLLSSQMAEQMILIKCILDLSEEEEWGFEKVESIGLLEDKLLQRY